MSTPPASGDEVSAPLIMLASCLRTAARYCWFRSRLVVLTLSRCVLSRGESCSQSTVVDQVRTDKSRRGVSRSFFALCRRRRSQLAKRRASRRPPADCGLMTRYDEADALCNEVDAPMNRGNVSCGFRRRKFMKAYQLETPSLVALASVIPAPPTRAQPVYVAAKRAPVRQL